MRLFEWEWVFDDRGHDSLLIGSTFYDIDGIFQNEGDGCIFLRSWCIFGGQSTYFQNRGDFFDFAVTFYGQGFFMIVVAFLSQFIIFSATFYPFRSSPFL